MNGSDAGSGKAPLKFRPAGSPAGTWHHTPWWVCVFHDPYERINFWSHFIPGLVFIALGVMAVMGNFEEHSAVMAIFCGCATATHILSALTHVWPDDHVLEKVDHIGIVALIVGTPLTAALTARPDGELAVMGGVALMLVVVAFLPPLLRTVSFVALGGVLLLSYAYIINYMFVMEVGLYVLGACFFIRNSGHQRWEGWTDHHLLHYSVTSACALHVQYILSSGPVVQ